MRINRLLSLILCFAMIFTGSTLNVNAVSLNMNDGLSIKTVETDENQFFNVIFTDETYKPSALSVYEMYMGTGFEMWRYSGDMDASTPGSQNWATLWGYKTDEFMKELYDNQYELITSMNATIPEGVQQYLKNGGSWDKIKVTFVCMNEDGVAIDKNELFVNGAVDGKVKWGKEIELTFVPKFKVDKAFVSDKTAVAVRRGTYPFSYTQFAMWDKNGKIHYGATRVHDVKNGEPADKYAGYDSLFYEHILNSKGDLKAGLKLKNIEAYKEKMETGQKPSDSISTNNARIGAGTFNMAGATGVGFSFPVKVIFEIKPNEKGRASIVNEVGFVEVGSRETYGHLQMYGEPNSYLNSFKDDSGNALGSTEALKKVLKT